MYVYADTYPCSSPTLGPGGAQCNVAFQIPTTIAATLLLINILAVSVSIYVCLKMKGKINCHLRGCHNHSDVVTQDVNLNNEVGDISPQIDGENDYSAVTIATRPSTNEIQSIPNAAYGAGDHHCDRTEYYSYPYGRDSH